MSSLDARLKRARDTVRAAAQDRFLSEVQDHVILSPHRILVDLGALEDPDGKVEAVLRSRRTPTAEEQIAAAPSEEREEAAELIAWLQSISDDELHWMMLPSIWAYYRSAAPAFGLPRGRERVLHWARLLMNSREDDLAIVAHLEAASNGVFKPLAWRERSHNSSS